MDLEAAIVRQDPSLLVVDEPPAVADDCPYKGLAAYDEADIDSFFGREGDLAIAVSTAPRSGKLSCSPNSVGANS